MILRAFAFASAVLGGASASQFPEYSQQYLQRLSGAVEELTRVTTDFDRTAQDSGLTREEALAQYAGNNFLDKRQADMRRTVKRQA